MDEPHDVEVSSVLMILVKDCTPDPVSTVGSALETTGNTAKSTSTDVLVVSEAGKWFVYTQQTFNVMLNTRHGSNWKHPKAYHDDAESRYLAFPQIDAKTARSLVPGKVNDFDTIFQESEERHKGVTKKSFLTDKWWDASMPPKDSQSSQIPE